MQLYLERNFADKHSTTLPCWLRLELTFAPFNTHYGSQISESCGIKVVREAQQDQLMMELYTKGIVDGFTKEPLTKLM